MHHYKKFAASLLVGAFIFAGIAATRPKEDPPHKHNFKVLKNNISDEDLDKIMDGFKAALGVKCNFCHAQFTDTSIRRLDFPSDEKPEKNIARKMMRMANKINKKYFSFNKNAAGVTVPSVTCMTCHRGSPHPGEKSE